MDDDWLSGFNRSCDKTLRLYCIETLDVTINMPTLTSVAGASPGDVDLTIDFPADTTGYGSVQITRQEGASFSNEACYYRYNSPNFGISIHTYDGLSYEPFVDDSLADSTAEEGIYNYAACVFDTFGNLIGISRPSAAVTTGTDFLRAFITSAAYNGDLDDGSGGVAGANARCATRATAGGLAGTWKAIIADGTNGIMNNLPLRRTHTT